MIESLAADIKAGRAILFVGAGVSACLGLPTWRALVGHLGEELGFEADVFSALGDSFLQSAEYYRLEKGTIGPLRSWMDRQWSVPDEKILGSRIHELIVRLAFPLIYTTNYDQLLERAFQLRGQPVNTIVNALDVARSKQSLPTIVKFHGDFTDDDSLVLSEGDYFRRLSFETPLDIKLRGDVLGRTLLFVGYSLSDINIRFLLYKLKNMWRESGFEKSQPSSYVFMSRPNIIQERILDSWGVRAIVGEHSEGKDSTGESALSAFLEQLHEAVIL